jgi:hypothetical protein
MKRILMTVALMLGAVSFAIADPTPTSVTQSTAPVTPPAVSTNTPAAVSAIGDGLLAGKVLTGATLRDCIHGQWMLGAEAPLYKKYYLSPDLGIAYPISDDTSNTHGFYYLSGRFWAGEFLYDYVPLVHQYADATSFTALLLQYGTIGGWGGRDFDNGVYRAGFDAGLTVQFSGTGYTSPTAGSPLIP